MGIEGGSIGPSIRGISSGIEGGFEARGGPNLGGIRGGIVDLEATVPLGRIGFSIVNEGPVIPEALNTMDIVAKPISPNILGEIVFKPSQLSVIQQAVVPSGTRQAMDVAAAELIISQAQKIAIPEVQPFVGEPKTAVAAVSLPYEIPIRRFYPLPLLRPVFYPEIDIDLEEQVQPQLKPAAGVSYEPASFTAGSVTRVDVQPAISIAAPETVEEEEVVEERKEEMQPKDQEEQVISKLKLVEDQQVSENRRHEIKTAIKRAWQEAWKLDLKTITGKLVKQFLPDSWWKDKKYKSPIVGEGKDWTINTTTDDLEADRLEYESEREAEKLINYVSIHIPVKAGTGSRVATIEEVREVLRGREAEPVRGRPAEVVIRRIARKRQLGGEVASLVSERTVKEGSLEDFPALADVFGHSMI